MPIISATQLAPILLQANAKWRPKDSWLAMLSDAQRSRLLGVTIDRANLQAILAAPQAPTTPGSPLPSAVDWRSKGGRSFISPVKDQKSCGSCVSFCCSALVEAMAAIEKNLTFLDLSEADLHFCSGHGESCGGWWPNDALDDLKARGIVDEGAFPYDSAFDSAGPHCRAVANRATRSTKITSHQALTRIADCKRWLAEVGPVSAVFHVYNDFYSYGTGVYTHSMGAEAGYHCVEVVGYDDADGCWICKNSWRDTWGDHGFFKIAYGQCGIDSTSEDTDSAGNVLHFPMWGATGVVPPASAAPDITELCAAINSDGRLEVFAIAKPNAAALNIWQTAPHAGPWSQLNTLGGAVNQLCSALNSDGRLELFGIGTDDVAYNMWQVAPHAGPWSGWNRLGGGVKQLAAACNSDGRLELFGIGMDNALYHMWQGAPHAGPWSGWSSLGGAIKQISPVLNSDGRLEVFAIGMDDALYNIWQTAPHAGRWGGWNRLGGAVKRVAAVRNTDGRIEVFGIGMDDALYNTWQTTPHAGPWSGWNSLGGLLKQIAPICNSDGRLEVFGIGMDDALHNIWQAAAHVGPWSGWNALGGKVKRIAAACNSDGRLEVFGIGTDDRLYNNWQVAPHAGPWSGWNKLT